MEARPTDAPVRDDPFQRPIADISGHGAVWCFGSNKNIVVRCFLRAGIAQVSEQGVAYGHGHRDPGICTGLLLAETYGTVLPVDVLQL